MCTLPGRRWLWPCVALLSIALAGCGGGNSTETTTTGLVVSVDTPTGPNTTEIVVDTGPSSGFSLGAANIPYVTVTVCSPGSTTSCATIDHVFLDTGSYGFRVLKSALGQVALPPLNVPADAASSTPAGPAAECYPFVLGAVWGPLMSADLHVAGETASALPIQVIDDSATPAYDAPAKCGSPANGGLLKSVDSLQANGILGVGMVRYDCGLPCVTGDYSGGDTLYYSCPTPASCVPAAIPSDLQMQNPVAHFPLDNNGTIIALPALPDFGAYIAKGRLVFGIGTQSNNQIPPAAKMYLVDADPHSATYLYVSTTVGATTYPYSSVDSGSNAFFFEDPAIPKSCASSSGTTGGWYCPASQLNLSATVTDSIGTSGQVAFSVASADVLFSGANTAFSNLAGSVGQDANAFVWGLPFFYGRSVYTSIWGQTLSPNGPWLAF
jgi:hypothetical protein